MQEIDPFDNIPLQDIVTKPDDADNHARYKTIMGNAISYMYQLALEEDWSLIEPHNSECYDRISLFEKPRDDKGFYRFKVSGVVTGRADRYLYILRDHQKVTRGMWDTEDVLDDMDQYETYKSDEGELTFVASTIKSPVPRLVAHRYLMGLEWSGFDPELQTYKLVFKTADHPFIVCPADGRVAADATIGVFIKRLEQADDTCELTILVKINFAGNAFGLGFWLSKYVERLRQRVYLYERVVSTWPAYYGPERNPKVHGTEARERLFS